MWSHIQDDLSAGQFASKLFQIGDGKVPEDPSTDFITMLCGQIVNSPDELLSKVFPNIQQNFKDQNWLSPREILASRNDVVEKLNVTIQKQLPGQEYAYKSIDCILNDDEAVQYPTEFLNSNQTPYLQAHNLILKVGAPIMLIRNINAPWLCNGTRLIVKKPMQHLIQATVLTGCAKGCGYNTVLGGFVGTPIFTNFDVYQ
ncbi:ATP-dependent DNA helicase [Trichonephila clavata]|uniref:ATP-dependent DNA helicase n=1 Tax=Trichonephila clavata TaxID=2740835 RepID=A0A8X6K3B5_TRICU|nr:ATP-dependent DNA helicase [Trichonephila clavata]